MNKKFLLTLLSTPVVFTSLMSMVVMSRPVQAVQTVDSTGTHLNCVAHPHTATARMVCIKVSNNIPVVKPTTDVKVAQANPNQITELKFTDAESDEAIRLFGCDCPRCMNSVRQLHGMAPMPV
ncbi:MAG: hypothetical protein PUP93_25505 [Rhizonema sp. NSF051]|nr:hypothetical protein [Rhizonema sp. NSF051]